MAQRPAPATAGRLMICNIGRAGDTILSNAILDSAFRTYARVDYLCGRHNTEVMECDSRLNNLIVFQNSLSGLARLLKAVVGRRYDAFIGLKDCHSSTNLLLAKIFSSRLKTGWNSDRFQPFHRDVRSIDAPGLHKVEMMRRIGKLAGLESGEYKPSLIVGSKSIHEFRRNYPDWQKPFIFINLSATDAGSRMWPVESWASYVSGCGLDQENILINGLPRDQALVQRLCQKFPRAAALRARGFMDVAAAIAHARLVLTVDTGVVHASSALNRPVMALYCDTPLAVKYAPLSTWRLAIRAGAGRHVPDIPWQEAVAQTKRYGLPGDHAASGDWPNTETAAAEHRTGTAPHLGVRSV